MPWVDLLMIHWPNAQIPLSQSIAALCKVKKAGLAKNIGVANSNVAMLDEAAKLATEPLAALQIEVHPISTRPKSSPRRAATAWPWSLLPAGARQGAGRRDFAARRPRPRQIPGAGRAAVPRTGQHHSDSADIEARAARRKSRQPRFQAQRRGNDRDRQAQSGRTPALSVRRQAPKWDT